MSLTSLVCQLLDDDLYPVCHDWQILDNRPVELRRVAGAHCGEEGLPVEEGGAATGAEVEDAGDVEAAVHLATVHQFVATEKTWSAFKC